MKHKLFKLLGTIGVATLTMSYSANAMISDTNSYRETYYFDQGQQIKTQSAIWSKSKSGAVLAGDQLVFIQESNGMLAVDPKSGTKKWRFAKGNVDYAQLVDNKLYIHDTSGNLSILQASTGQVLKTIKTNVSTMSKLDADDQSVYFIYGEYPNKGIAAFDMNSGKKKWDYKREESRYQSVEISDQTLLVNTVESGAITQSQVYGLDLKTGESLWGHSGVHGPIYQTNKHYYFEYSGMMGYSEDDLFIIVVVDKKTGEKVNTHYYKDPNFKGNDGGTSYPAVDRAAIKDNYLYLGKGPKLYRYDITKDPSLIEPYEYGYNIAANFYNGRYEWVLGPHNDQAFYIMDERLKGKILGKDHAEVAYEGITNPITTIDAIDNGLYVGTTDHHFTALNIETGKAFFKAKLNEGIKGALVVGDTVLVETAKNVTAFPVPKEASVKAEKSEPRLPGFQKADAGITINGQPVHMKTKPVFVQSKMYLPFRELFELLNAKVDYDAKTKKIYATTKNSRMTLTPNETKAILNEKEMIMEKMPFIHEGVTYVPLRAAATLLGAEVKWDTGTRTVFIEMK